MEVKPILTVKEVAEILQINLWYAYELVHQGKIKAVQTGRKKGYRVSRESVMNFVSGE